MEKAACHFRDDASTGQPVAGFFAHKGARFRSIVLHSDNARANRLQKTPNYRRIPALALVALLLGCESPPEGEEAPPVAEITCGDEGFLAAELYGSIEREVSWTASNMQCESMLRPDGEGVRLRFTGETGGRQLAIILALPALERGMTGEEIPTVATLTVEGSGRFFSTPNLGSCWSDIAAHDPLGAGEPVHDIQGALYCVAPLGEVNGDAAISIPQLEFRAIVDWGAE